VGESGCGKSTLGGMLVHLLEPTGGSIIYKGVDITHANAKKLRELREEIQIIFQDPYSSLNPRMTVEQTIMEPLIISGHNTKSRNRDEVKRLMAMVGIDEKFRFSFPHELDSGRRQRVGIGRALAMNPKFIVCDEPVSSLDVSIQAQILNLLKDLQDKMGLTYMFITHDLSVVRYISDNICVMYLGQLVETCSSKDLFKNPLHPYTQAIFSAVPSIFSQHKKERIILEGEIVSPINPKSHCRFAKRCKYFQNDCLAPQELREIKANHFVACCRVDLINQIY
jgi:peptide/nickel transport system ATP-binding protein